MPTRSYPWNLIDEIAQPIIRKMIEQTRLSYRAFSDETDGLIKYTRVRDICLAKNAPVRLSEFFSICDVCDKDPVEVIRQIKTLADKRIGIEPTGISPISAQGNDLSDDEKRDIVMAKVNAGDMGLAALHDPNKEIEMRGEAGPDWDDPA